MKKKKKKTIQPVAKRGVRGTRSGEPEKAIIDKIPELRVLILEDNPVDAELMERQLRKAGIAFVFEHVKTRAAFQQALKKLRPELILADYSLPNFDALQALAICKKMAPAVPFIIVSGSISEEIAVACMKQGADDYLLKDRLSRLGEAVRHALEARRLQLEKAEAEETLRKSEENFADIFQAVREGIAYTTLSGKVLAVNPALEQILEISRDDIVGRNILNLTRKLLAKDVAKKAIPALKKLLQGKEIAALQVEYRNRVLEINATANRKTKRLTGVIRDITEHRRYEAALQAAAVRWRTTFDSMSDAVCLLDEKGCVLQCNQAMHGLLGLPFKKIVGRDCLSLVCGPGKKPGCAFRLLLQDGRRHEEETYWRKRWFLVTVDPVIGAAGQAIGAVHIMTDITKQKESEDSLQASAARYRQIFDLSGIGIGFYSPSGKLLMFNRQAARNMGGDPADFADKNLKELYPGALGRTIQRRIRSACRDKAHLEYEDRVTLPTGDKWFLSDYTAITDHAGRVSGVQIISRDITERKKIEAELRENEAFMDSIIEQSPLAMWISDSQGTLQRINPASCKMLHITPDEVIGKYNLLQDNIIKTQGLLPLARRVFEKGETARFEITYDTAQLQKLKLAEKASLILDTTIFPIKDSQGRVTHAIIQNLDISQRRRAEESLREMNEIFRHFLKHNPIYVFIKDENIRPVYLSANYEKLLGRPLGEILGKSMDELFPSELSRSMIEDDKKILRDGIPREFIEELGDRIYSTLKFPIIIDGKPKYMAGYTTDITERRQTEDALQENQARLNAFMDFVPSLILIKDHELRPIYANEAMRQNFPIDQWLGKKPHELFPAAVADLMVSKDSEALAKGFTIYEEDWLDRFEQQRFFLTQKFRIDRPQKEPLLGAIISDISERKQAENRLKASLIEKETLLKEIHHRVKNNLQVISGLLTLQAAQINDERFQRMIKESQGRIWTMALIHQTLYQSGNLADIDMSDYISTLSGNLLSSHAQVAMPPNVRFDLLPLRLSVDKAIPLALIINELLTNALKHAFPGGRSGEINIILQKQRKAAPGEGKARPAQDAHEYELIVADNGAGLPAGFDLKSQKSLGLQLVAMLTQQLGGSLIAANKAGAVFRVAFDTHDEKK